MNMTRQLRAFLAGDQTRLRLVWLLLVVFYGIHALRYIHVNLDDQYILYKYSINLVRGHGFVYNPGEPLEGFTTFLYVVIMAGVFLLAGISDSSPDSIVLMTVLGKGFNLLCTFGTLAYLVWLLKAVLKLGAAGILISLLPLVASIDFVYSSSNGLETGLVILEFSGMAAHFLKFNASGLSDRRSIDYGLGWVATLILSRADGVLLSGVFLAAWFCVSWLQFAERRTVLLGLILPIALTVIGFVGGYEIFRWLYFHDLFANTYYVKLSGKTGEVFDPCYWGTWGYVKGFWRWTRPLFFYIAPSLWVASVFTVLLFIARCWTKQRGASIPKDGPALWPLLIMASATALLAVYICVVGGDWMPGSRYVMQFGTVFIALAFGSFIAFCLSNAKQPRRLLLLVYTLLIAIGICRIEQREAKFLQELAQNGTEIDMPENHGYSVLRKDLNPYQLFSLYSGFLARFADRIQPGDTLAFYEAGSPGLRFGDQTGFIDLSALNDRAMAHANGENAIREGIKSLCLNFFYLPDAQVRGARDRYILSKNPKAIVFDRFIPQNIGKGLPRFILGGKYILLASDSYGDFFSVYWRLDALSALFQAERAHGLKPWRPALLSK